MKRILFASLPLCLALASLHAQQKADPNAQYVLGIDSMPKPGVPHGKVIAMEPWKSKIYDGTVRDWWIYVPAQYDGSKPAARHGLPGRRQGEARGQELRRTEQRGLRLRQSDPREADARHHRHLHQPRAISRRNSRTASRAATAASSTTRPDGTYAHFLLEEILPEVGKNYKLTDKPEERGIVGGSSGGICAFTVAWERPDQFQQGREPHRQLHQHPRRLHLSRGHPQDEAGKLRRTSTTRPN